MVGQSRSTSLSVAMSAIEHPARRVGISTACSSRVSTSADSAMKWTPQNTMVVASESAAFRLSMNESPM